MRLHFILVHPTHYFAFFLRHLQKTVGNEIEISVHFLDEVNKNYPWTTDFRKGYKSRVLNGSLFDKILLKNIIKEPKSVFILAGWERIDKLFLIFILSILGRKYLIYTDTPDTYKFRGFFKDFFRNTVLKFISNYSFGIIVTGKIGVQKIEEWPFKFKNIFNLPFFVDLDYFRPLNTKSELSQSDHLVFFSSGRLLNSHKGFDIALNALGSLKCNKSLKNFSYFIAGEGPDRLIIEKLIETNDLKNEVKILGWTEPDLLLYHYQNSHIFLHPSHFDPYPNAVLEAMACGLAIIASNKAGSAIDRIESGLSGLIFNDGIEIELQHCIIELNVKRELIGKFGIAARENALKWPVNFGQKVVESILLK